MKYYAEAPGFCCMNGQVSLIAARCLPELEELYSFGSEESEQFRTHIRTYNSVFSFTSFGVKYDKELCRRTNGIYTFRVQGQIYHFLNELQSSIDKVSPLQLYFYDTEHGIDNRMKHSKKLRPSILKKLIQILSINLYSAFFGSLTNAENLDTHRIVINSNLGLDQRVYNHPTSSQVAAIWTKDDTPGPKERNIVVQRVSGSKEKIQHYFGCYDALQYPLLFPHGETGWHKEILRVDKKREEDCA